MEENNYQTGNDTNAQDGMQSGAENMGTDAVNNSAKQASEPVQSESPQQGSTAAEGTAQQNSETYEQRPSQLYGRTAYQQQNQANAQNNNPYNNQYGSQNGYNNQYNNQYGNQNGYSNQYNNQYGNQNGYNNQYNNQYGSQNGYNNQYNNPYGNQNGYHNQYGYQNKPMHGKVSDIFCYFLLVIMPLANVISIVLYNMVFKLMEGLSYEAFESEYTAKVMELSTQPAYLAVSMLTYVVAIGYIVFVILDIVKIHKENYKITGLILFAIFLKPGYFLWRAHVLGRKKTVPVLYTIGYCALILGQWIFFVVKIMNISMAMVEGMY